MNIFVTGANGFLGERLVEKMLHYSNYSITACVRRKKNISAFSSFEINNIDGNTKWLHALKNQDIVIHVAGKTGLMSKETSTSIEEYKKVNVNGTLNLAEQAAISGVKRFIFISSIKVNGEKTILGKPFTENDKPQPIDAYSISKWTAERGLQKISKKTGMEIVIIRPSLIYGPGVKGNFKKIVSLVKTRLPTPLGAINNKRSFIAIDNLIDLIIICIHHPSASNEIFLAADGEDLSISQLIRKIAKATNKTPILIPVPIFLLKIFALILRKEKVINRLLESLQVDISKSQNLLNWKPPISINEGLDLYFKKI